MFGLKMIRAVDYEKEMNENQKAIRDRVLESMSDIKSGKGRDYNDFFDELEKKYTDV